MTETQALMLFKCLADRSRLQILKSLAQEDMYVERLAQRLGLTPPTISPSEKAGGRRCGHVLQDAVLHHVRTGKECIHDQHS